PRFLASAFTAGPALIILALQVVRRVTSTLQTSGEYGSGQSTPHKPASRKADLLDFETLTRHLPELKTVPLDIARQVVAEATVLEAQPGDALLRQGEIGKDAFFVIEGRVVVKRQEGIRFRVTRTLGPGEQFGEISA